MQLTSRQQAFLEKLFDVYYRHRQQPIHYTDLARALGVANSTAYEVLKKLEQKGYVASEYRLSEHHAGPGRSIVLFRPTIKTLRRFRKLLGEDARQQKWELVKDKLLQRLAAEGSPDEEELLNELIPTIIESEDPLSYCARVLAASLLTIRKQLWSKVQAFGIFKDMAREDATALNTLDLLPGFALGLSCASENESSRLSRLAECIKGYQAHLHQMDAEARLRLLRFSREVIATLRIPVCLG